MPSVLYIHAYGGASAALHRNWPYFKRSGAVDIVGVEPLGCACEWPEPVRKIRAGEDAYFKMGSPHLIVKFMAGLKDHVKHKAYRNLASVHCEYDHLFTGTIPEFTGIQMNHAVGKIIGNKGSGGMHLPWGFDHTSAKQVWILGNRMLAAGDVENGSPDMWMYWLLEQYGISWQQATTFSVNGFDYPPTVVAAKQAIRCGAWCVHPFKTQDDMDKVFGDLRENNSCFAIGLGIQSNLPMTLTELAVKYGTDKGPLHHGYTRIYEQLFPHPESVQRVLEIGILWGSSLRMWHDWFTGAEIVGVDNVMQFKGERPPRITLLHADATKDFDHITMLGPFDLIIDDGSHFWAHIITAFESLFLNALAPGGFYVVEDMHVCWRPQHFQQGCPMNPMDYFKELVDKANWGGLSEWNRIYEPDGVVIEKDLTPLEKWIEEISFRKGLVIVRKAMR